MRGILVACLLWAAHPTTSAHAADEAEATVSDEAALELNARVKPLAVTGYSFVGVGGLFMSAALGTIIFSYMGPMELAITHWASLASWEICFYIGVPALLSSYIKARLAAGLEANDRLSITGWVLYALSGSLFTLSHALILVPWMFVAPAGAASLAAVVIGIVAAHRGMVMSGKAREVESRKVQIFPAIRAIPDGFVAGIGGTF